MKNPSIIEIKKKSSYTIALVLFLLLFISASCTKDPITPDPDINDPVSKITREINKWILDNMVSYYYWNEKIPGNLDPEKEEDPEAFFYKMLYKTDDKWSFITSDFGSLLAELEGTPLSTGISPAFIRISENEIVMIIEFVYPGSPADKAGLKRGDMVIKIDGKSLDINNYYELFSQNSLEVTLGLFSGGSLAPVGEPVSLQAATIEANPIIHSEVMDIQGKKTAYLVYTSFTSGNNEIFLDKLDSVMNGFKDAGVSELIVDLRYNRGGEISVASYLASAIAPAGVPGKEVLIKYEYNSGLNQFIDNNYGKDSPYLVLKFPSNNYNLNLSTVYFLNGWKTASASELINIGLRPYMQVVSIGDTTVGKYTGSWVIYDTNNPPGHDWAMMPIVLKYSNSQGFTDFKNGLAPDHYIDEFLLDLRPFGDPADPVLARAKELIGGGILAVSTKKTDERISYNKIIPGNEIWDRGVLIVPAPVIKYEKEIR